MPDSTYNLISRAFDENESNPPARRIKLTSPQLVIDADRLRTPDQVLLSEVWFRIKTETALTRAQIEAAFSLRATDSIPVEVAKTAYTATKTTEQQIAFGDFIDRYTSDSHTLSSIDDQPPTTTLNGRIIDGPVEVPTHAWSHYYAAFEAYYKDHPEFGMAWDSVVLYKDGIALRKAQAPNLLHAMLPQVAQMLEGTEFKNDSEAATLIQQLVKSDTDAASLTSTDNLFKRLSATPEPSILPAEINQMGEFASQVLGIDITKLEYSISA